MSRTGYLVAVGGVVLIALVLWPIFDRIDSVTAAAALLMLVLLVSSRWGTRPALLASILGVVYLNFFFVPSGTWRIAPRDDLVSLAAFLVTAATVGQLSARAHRRAAEAEQSRAEIQHLYDELHAAFERASQLEAVKRSEKFKSALLDSVTHDLRTPLTSIKAAASTLRNAAAKEAAGVDPMLNADVRHELAQVVVDEADRLNHFIEQMLELAKVESSGEAAQGGAATVEEVVAAALQRAESLTAQFRVEFSSAGDASAALVPKATAQVLFSLLENAARYAPPGSAISVIASRDLDSVVFEVCDEGPGIPRADRERIFEKFFRRTRSGGEASPGLGMGLSIARAIVESNGGRISAEDGRNQHGACFIVRLPMAGMAVPVTSEMSDE